MRPEKQDEESEGELQRRVEQELNVALNLDEQDPPDLKKPESRKQSALLPKHAILSSAEISGLRPAQQQLNLKKQAYSAHQNVPVSY